MEPQPLGGGERGDAGEIVDGPGVDGARGADDEEGDSAVAAITGHGLGQGCEVEAAIFAGGKQAQGVRAEPGDLHGLGDAPVRRARGVGREARGVAEAGGAHAGAEPRRARHHHGDEVGHRGAGDEQPARALGEAEELAAPGDHLALHVDGGVLAAADVGVHPGGEELGEHPRGRAAAVDPADEAGVDVARGEGEDGLAELVVEGVERRRPGGQRRRDPLAHGRGDGPPRRPLAHVAQVVDHVVEHAVPGRPEGLPVDRIQRLLVHGLLRSPVSARRAPAAPRWPAPAPALTSAPAPSSPAAAPAAPPPADRWR